MRLRVCIGRMAAIAAFGTFSLSAQAAETTTYTYDALGRVTGVSHSGGDNDGMATTLSYDPAGNRTQYAVTGSKNRGLGSNMTIVVVPLNGFTVIAVPN